MMPNEWIKKHPDLIDADESDFVAALHPKRNSKIETLDEGTPLVTKRFTFEDFHLVGPDWTTRLNDFRVSFSGGSDNMFNALVYFDVDSPVKKADDRSWRDIGILFELLTKGESHIAYCHMSMNRRCGNYLVEEAIPGRSPRVVDPIKYLYYCHVTVTYHTRVTWC